MRAAALFSLNRLVANRNNWHAGMIATDCLYLPAPIYRAYNKPHTERMVMKTLAAYPVVCRFIRIWISLSGCSIY